MATSTIWLSFDLGVRGDYEGLYAWLDSRDGLECGDAVAVLQYRHDGSLIDDLKADLKKALSVDKRSRIYVIYRDRMTDKNKGEFLFGGRRAAAWVGYAPNEADTVDQEI